MMLDARERGADARVTPGLPRMTLFLGVSARVAFVAFDGEARDAPFTAVLGALDAATSANVAARENGRRSNVP